jgi:AcrR family transcriptional regulator
VVEHHQRERIVAGAAAEIAERGYPAVSVTDIVRRAQVARRVFYAQFSSKEDCFFALYEAAGDAALEQVSAACAAAAGEPFPARVEAGLRSLLAYIEANREAAAAVIVAGPAVGPAINARMESLLAGFAALLRSGRGEAGSGELPETVEETVVGGLYWLLYYALLEGRPKRLSRRVPQLVDFSLIPFSGSAALGSRSPG